MELSSVDWYIGFFYCLIFVGLGFWYSSKLNKKSPLLGRFFIVGLLVHLLAALLYTVIYKFHFGGGDNVMYYNNIINLKGLISENPMEYLDLFGYSSIESIAPSVYGKYYKYLGITGVYLVVRVGIIFAFLGANNYIAISLFFSLFSFFGLWLLFRSLERRYPEARLAIFIALFLIPSITFWSSAMSKDAILIGVLGMMLSGILNLLSSRKSLINWLLIAFSFYCLLHVKQYIVYPFLLTIGIWLFIEKGYFSRRKFSGALIFISLMSLGFIVSLLWTEHRFLPTNWMGYAKEFYYDNLEGTSVDNDTGLNPDFTWLGLILLFPKAILFGLLKPFIWESKAFFHILSGMEALLFTIINLWVFFKILMSRSFDVFRKDPFLYCMLGLGLFLLAGITFATPNIGSLVRYRMVAWMFLGVPVGVLFARIEFKRD